MTVKARVLKPILPILLISLKSAIPRTIAVNIKGMTIIKIIRRNICPAGNAILLTIHSTDLLPSRKILQSMPRINPVKSPMKILV
jgi:hypothetical protein